MNQAPQWLARWFSFVGETSGSEWNRYLFRWERSNHVVWALVLFFGMLFGGAFLTLFVGRALHLEGQGLEWLRAAFMALFLTAWFSFVRPFRQGIVAGLAFFAAKLADLGVRSAGTDDWLALIVSIVAAMLTVVVAVRVLNLLDTRRRPHAA
ncbi:MAG: hypothetical protein U0Q11_10175 [Vicinamibacterales bacterium]